MDGPVLEVLDDLKRRGVIRFTGLGGTTVTEMAHLVRSNRFDVVLTAFNLQRPFREAAAEVLPNAVETQHGHRPRFGLATRALARRYDHVVHAARCGCRSLASSNS